MLKKEMEIRKDYLNGESVNTIYFGGGTPSILTTHEINGILEAIYRVFDVNKDPEITVEANPEDITAQKARELKGAGVNRLSIGVQTFNEKALKFLNRKHSSSDSKRCIEEASSEGFDNINIDLIYSIPVDEETCLPRDLEIIQALPVQHVSAYSLTIEEKTFFGHQVKKGVMAVPAEDFSASHFNQVRNGLANAGFEQYEISNFARNNKYSRHNSSYWFGEKYIGIGPGAHSYDINSRQSNVSNNLSYLRAIKKGEIPSSIEHLNFKEKVNDYILTGLRTKWGISEKKLKDLAGIIPEEFFHKTERFLIDNLIVKKDEHYVLTDKGKLLADEICMNLFLT